MQKVTFAGSMGAFEWTPPGMLQEKFERKHSELHDPIQKWMAELIKKYLEALLICQSTRFGQDFINEATAELVKASAGLKQPPKHLH